MKLESRTEFLRRFHVDRPAVCYRDLLRDIEPQSHALLILLLLFGGRNALEGIEDICLVSLRDHGSTILNRDGHFASLFSARGHHDRSGRASVLHRIPDQIGKSLAHPLPVPLPAQVSLCFKTEIVDRESFEHSDRGRMNVSAGVNVSLSSGEISHF